MPTRSSRHLRLLKDAFAPMEGRIDPPSSVHRLTPASLAAKSGEETLILATDDGALVGCVFASERGDALYVSKLAVRGDHRRHGIARRLVEAVERHARDGGLSHLELDTRIELGENHATFGAMGFVRTGERAHEGYHRPTFVTMRKRIAGAR